jgi:hypothetical protein
VCIVRYHTTPSLPGHMHISEKSKVRYKKQERWVVRREGRKGIYLSNLFKASKKEIPSAFRSGQKTFIKGQRLDPIAPPS